MLYLVRTKSSFPHIYVKDHIITDCTITEYKSTDYLPLSWGACQQQTQAFLAEGRTVIVSGAFQYDWEWLPYYYLAQQYHITPIMISQSDIQVQMDCVIV